MLRFIYNMVQADRKEAEASRINLKAFERASRAEAEVRQQEAQTHQSLERLVNRKRGILRTSMERFVRLYERLQKINWQEGDGIREALASALPSVRIDEIRSMSAVAGMSLTDGQAITLFLLGGISSIIKQEAEQNLSAASMRNRQARLIESHAATVKVAMDAVQQRADRLAQLLTRLNILFLKSLETVEQILEEQGTNRMAFGRPERERIMSCVNLAKAIKAILDARLIDDQGELAAQSAEAIQMGDHYMEQMRREINEA